MRFKEIPEDFYVKEILKENILKNRGEYSVYEIWKKNITTHEAIKRVALYFKIKPELINFCGLKDKTSVSVQYFSLPSYINKNFDMINLKGKFIGYSDKPLSPSSLKYNFFKVLLRNVKLKDEILERIEEIKIFGLPNYFDHQRFGHA
ncbi:MAG: tRNA pseudouridine(13) synthase TruD, partial [candidate division WOR-3 bacterium]